MSTSGSSRARRWWLGLLDWGLSRERRQLSPDELGRYRVVLGATVLLGLLNLFYLAFLRLYPPAMRLSQELVVLVSLSSLVGVGVLVRRGRSPTLPAFLLCASLSLAVIWATLAAEVPGAVSHAANMLIPALAVYLVGPRLGFVFTALFVLNAAFFHELYHSGFGQLRPLFAQPRVWWSNAMAGLSLLLGWALSWLYSSSREESQTALMRTLQTLRESEGKLVSLIESTDDAVLAFDAQMRLLTVNHIAHETFQGVTGGRLVLGELVLPLCPPALGAFLQAQGSLALKGQRVRAELDVRIAGKTRTMDITFNPVREGARVVGLTVFSRDITERKQAEARMAALHRNLMDASRQAGMAEIATGVLHNVGNTLNSVNVSANLVVEQLRGSRAPGLDRVVELLRENSSRLGTFLEEDPRGQQLPAYLEALALQLTEERAALLEEMGRLDESVAHIRSVVSMQQRHARVSGVLEWVALPGFLDEALKAHAIPLEQQGILLRRDYGAELPRVLVDRHKLMQILDNLLSNARHALSERGDEGKHLTVCVQRAGERLRISVSDDGVGLAPEQLSRLFTQGFAPKNDGHGFGLHQSALAAGELGGSLSCTSEGPGRGATFTLELPLGGRALAPAGR